MKLEVLVSAVEKDAAALLSKMNIATDAVLVNQCDRYGYETLSVPNGTARCFSMPERGVGLSRNTALLHASGEQVLFSDEDIVLSSDYAEKVMDAYRALPDADLILFNVKVAPARRTYWNRSICRVTWKNYGRYPAYSISAKLSSLRRANVHYSLLFGGGAKYSNGEDSLFCGTACGRGLPYMHIRPASGRRRSVLLPGLTAILKNFSATGACSTIIFTEGLPGRLPCGSFWCTGRKCVGKFQSRKPIASCVRVCGRQKADDPLYYGGGFYGAACGDGG